MKNLYSVGTARGLYTPSQFVVRLHPSLQAHLSTVASGIHSSGEYNYEVVSAYSTYIHETIHWWQHIGSTVGLMLSMCYPAQAHVNHSDLKILLNEIGPIKSLRQFHSGNPKISIQGGHSLNKILNNWHDIEFCRRIIFNPESIQNCIDAPYFNSVGHCYEMAWGIFLWLFASTVDPNFKVIPDLRKWEKEFGLLRSNQVAGYYSGSPVYVPPVGAREIFEGQARFSQIQYLHGCSGGSFEWSDFHALGMLNGVYIKAFKVFLDIIGEQWPTSVNHPLVALFLLVCDLSANPTEGFPFDISHYESFILDVDPGMRFYRCCHAINKYSDLKKSIHNYSRQEYMDGSEIICRELICPTPMQAARRVSEWSTESSSIATLLEEDSHFRFTSANMPVRVLLSRFMQFQSDKLSHPEFLVWPGIWATSSGGNTSSLEEFRLVFERNEPLFLDAPDGEIRPRLIPGRDESDISNTLNEFYSWCANYSLTIQWIVKSGPFDLDFQWLTKKYSKTEMHSWAKHSFENTYGVALSDFTIV